MQDVVWLCLAEICKAFPEEDVIWMGAYVALKPVYNLSALTMPFKMCKFPVSKGTNAPQYHQRCKCLNWALITSRLDLVFSLEDADFQKDFPNLINLTTAPFSTLSQSILCWLWPGKDSSVSGSCSHMSSFLHDSALTCIYGRYSELCSQTMISGSVPKPMQWFPGQNHVCF